MNRAGRGCKERGGSYLVYVSHEATRTIGGVGVVLEKLLHSAEYQETFPRTLLVSPLVEPCGQGSFDLRRSREQELEQSGAVLYSGLRRRNPSELEQLFKPLETRHNVSFVYGVRQLSVAGGRVGRNVEAEVLLVDFSDVLRNYRVYMKTAADFVRRLREAFGVEIPLHYAGARSATYRLVSAIWRLLFGARWGASTLINKIYRGAIRHGLISVPSLDYDALAGVLLAEPVFEALQLLKGRDGVDCVILAQEHLSLPLAYRAKLEGADRCRTVYYAGEVRSAKILIEYGDRPDTAASDSRFYNVLRQARRRNLSMDRVFDVSTWMSFQILRHGYLCDRLAAVGEFVAEELRFLDERYASKPIAVVPHGTELIDASWRGKQESRQLLLRHLRGEYGIDCKLIMTRVARAEICKAMMRDLLVCEYLSELPGAENLSAVLLIVTQWDRNNAPPLVYTLLHRAEELRRRRASVRVEVINQADWPVGAGFSREDLHRATDVTFGQSMYESFGLAQLEPLSCGAVCVLSGVSGARAFVREVCARAGQSEEYQPNIIVADYTLPEEAPPAVSVMADWQALTHAQQEVIERAVARRVARKLFERLPRDDAERHSLLRTGRDLAERMRWDSILAQRLVPLLRQTKSTLV